MYVTFQRAAGATAPTIAPYDNEGLRTDVTGPG